MGLYVAVLVSSPYEMRHLLIVSCALTLVNIVSARTITVFAASSLTEAFSAIAVAFEVRQPGTNVALNFASSSLLSTQLLQGAPADVFASADKAQMAPVVDAGLTITDPRVFALNVLAVITPVNSNLVKLPDLQEPGLLLILAAPEVPAGRYAHIFLARLEEIYGVGFAGRVLANLASEELNVRQAAAKIALDEADAAIVYRSDLLSLRGIRQLPLPEGVSPVAHYPIAPLTTGLNPDLAAAFVEFVLSDQGQAIVARHGFMSP
jgi:molybdate transport system substrate-binding protein